MTSILHLGYSLLCYLFLARFNDLWKFDGTQWAWVSGANVATLYGTYGTKGIASPFNVPGARDTAVSWIDSSNNLWLFGGDRHATGLGIPLFPSVFPFSSR
jgi:hypothetical protein